MRTLSIILAVCLVATLAMAQDSQPVQARPERPAIAPEVQHRGPMGPAFRGGQRVSPNDKESEWDVTLGARRDAFRHQLNPNGPYPRGPMWQRGPQGPPARGPMWARGQQGPQFRGPPDRPQKGCQCQCQCQQGKGKGHRNQWRHGHGR